jgi:hypothetical protein
MIVALNGHNPLSSEGRWFISVHSVPFFALVVNERKRSGQLSLLLAQDLFAKGCPTPDGRGRTEIPDVSFSKSL